MKIGISFSGTEFTGRASRKLYEEEKIVFKPKYPPNKVEACTSLFDA